MIKKIKLQFIPTNIIFIIGRDNYNSWMDKEKIDGYMQHDGVTTSIIHNKKGHSVVVSIEPHPNIYETKALITHELSHAVTMIFKEHGFDCDELRSYLLQYLHKTIMKFYDDWTIKA